MVYLVAAVTFLDVDDACKGGVLYPYKKKMQYLYGVTVFR